MVSDLSLIGTLTGGNVETKHILLVEPVTSMVASTLASLDFASGCAGTARGVHQSVSVHDRTAGGFATARGFM